MSKKGDFYMWTRGLEYKEKKKKKLEKIDKLPFYVYVKYGKYVTWSNSGHFRRSYKCYKKMSNRKYRRMDVDLNDYANKSNYYKRYSDLWWNVY